MPGGNYRDRGFSRASRRVFAGAILPQGTRVATASRDGAIRLRDFHGGEQVARLLGHSNYIWSLAFSPDGATLASGSGDGTVRLRIPQPTKLRHQAKRDAESIRPEAVRLLERILIGYDPTRRPRRLVPSLARRDAPRRRPRVLLRGSTAPPLRLGPAPRYPSVLVANASSELPGFTGESRSRRQGRSARPRS